MYVEEERGLRKKGRHVEEEMEAGGRRKRDR